MYMNFEMNLFKLHGEGVYCASSCLFTEPHCLKCLLYVSFPLHT